MKMTYACKFKTNNCIKLISFSRGFSDLARDINISNSVRWEKSRPFEQIPGPIKLPIWGNLYLYKLGYYQASQYHKVLESLYQKYGPLVRENHGSNPVVHVFEPDDVKTVYMSEGTMPRVVPLQETVQVFREQNKLSPGLGNTNGEEWYKLRSAIRKMILRPKEVHYYLPFVNSVAIDFINHINKKKNSEGIVNGLKDEVAKWSQESAGMVCFEERLGCMDDGPNELNAQKMVDANRLIFELSGQLKFSLPIYKYISTPKWRRLKEAEEFVYSTTVSYVNKTITKLQNGLSNNKYTFMTHLLGREELSRNDVIVLTLSLFADGLSTTVPVLIYNLYCLATNPEAQNKAYNEISSVTRKGEEISAEILNSLSYLKAIIKETFRLFPNGTEVSRIIQKDLVLSGYQVPAGTHVNLTPNVQFCSEKFFTNPLSFSPERWLRRGETDTIHPFLLTPFSHGARTCAGRRFAEQDLNVVLCHILLNFELKYKGDKPLEQVYNILLFPKGQIDIQFIPRC